MSGFLSSRIETKVSLAIVLIITLVMLFTIFKALKSFNKFYDKLNQDEELRVEKSK